MARIRDQKALIQALSRYRIAEASDFLRAGPVEMDTFIEYCLTALPEKLFEGIGTNRLTGDIGERARRKEVITELIEFCAQDNYIEREVRTVATAGPLLNLSIVYLRVTRLGDDLLDRFGLIEPFFRKHQVSTSAALKIFAAIVGSGTVLLLIQWILELVKSKLL